MAKCQGCGQEMLNHISCKYNHVQRGDEIRERIKCGDPEDLHRITLYETCSDCGAPYGAYHHIGCDNECCPFCGEQLFLCDCDIYYLAIPNPPIKPFVYDK